MSVANLKGLGPKSAIVLSSIGIDSTEKLLATDAYKIYALIKQKMPATSLNILYAILGAQENIHWQEIAKNRRQEILMRLDDMGLAPK